MKKNNLQTSQTLGIAYENHKKGNLELAKSLYEKILKIDSNNFEAIFLLGSLFLQTRSFQEAIRYLNKCILIQPKHANSYQNLGYAFVEIGEFEKAKGLFFKAIEIEPNHADAYFNLANTFKQMRNFKKAQEFYEKTIQIQPNNPSAHNNYGNICKQLGEFEKAIASYSRAIELKSNHPRAHHNLGNTYNQLGEYSKAITSFKRAYQLQPFNLESLYNWSDLDNGILDLKLKKNINLIMKNKQLPKKYSAYGNFLFAKYELGKHNYEEEFNYLEKGHIDYFNSKKIFFEKGVNYWLKDLPKTKELENISKKEIDNDTKPIFIVGVPRCGSTVVEKVIASGSKSIPIGEECSVINTFIGDKILKKESLNFDVIDLKNQLNNKYRELGLLKKESDHIFTDKTLDNFFFLDIIKEIFPKAKIINCKRNPISSIMSILKNNLGDVAWAHQLEHIFLYFDIYHVKMNNFKNKYPDFIYDLIFEDFQSDPENESKKIMKFCNLPWDKKCLEFHKRKDLISYTASHSQIRKPIYKISKDKNKPYKGMLSKHGSKYNWFN